MASSNWRKPRQMLSANHSHVRNRDFFVPKGKRGRQRDLPLRKATRPGNKIFLNHYSGSGGREELTCREDRAASQVAKQRGRGALASTGHRAVPENPATTTRPAGSLFPRRAPRPGQWPLTK